MDSAGGILGPCVPMSSARNKPGLRQEEAGSAACGLVSPCSGRPTRCPVPQRPPGLPRAGKAASSLSAKRVCARRKCGLSRLVAGVRWSRAEAAAPHCLTSPARYGTGY